MQNMHNELTISSIPHCVQVTHSAPAPQAQPASTCSQTASIVGPAAHPAPATTSARLALAPASRALQTAQRAAQAATPTCRRMLPIAAPATTPARAARSVRPAPAPAQQVRPEQGSCQGAAPKPLAHVCTTSALLPQASTSAAGSASPRASAAPMATAAPATQVQGSWNSRLNSSCAGVVG